MGRRSDLEGHVHQAELPLWDPLFELVGEQLGSRFMWMFEVRIGDRAVHAYKHVRTRRYLHVQPGGVVFDYTAQGRYRPIDPALAVECALAPWARLGATREEMNAVWDTIDRLHSSPADAKDVP